MANRYSHCSWVSFRFFFFLTFSLRLSPTTAAAAAAQLPARRAPGAGLPNSKFTTPAICADDAAAATGYKKGDSSTASINFAVEASLDRLL